LDGKKGSGSRVGLAIFIVNLLISLVTYPMLPERIIIHWGAGGTPDGYSSKLLGFLLMQLVQVFVLGIYYIIPRVDPQGKVTASSGYFSNTMNLLLVYFTFFNGLFIAQNLGYEFNMTLVIVPAVGVLLFFLGHFMSKAERNWFYGIRTPWTLSSDEVWRSTHEKAGLLFKVCGVIAVLSVLVPKYSIWLVVLPITLAGLYLVVFSYTEFKKTG
jgi:uncharacterized membrane protein